MANLDSEMSPDSVNETEVGAEDDSAFSNLNDSVFKTPVAPVQKRSVSDQKPPSKLSFRSQPSRREALIQEVQDLIQKYQELREEGQRKMEETKNLIMTKTEEICEKVERKFECQVKAQDDMIYKLVERIQECDEPLAALEMELTQFATGMEYFFNDISQ